MNDHYNPEMPPAGGHRIVGAGGSGSITDVHSDIFFAAVETTRMPMIVTDPNQPDNPVVFANPAFLHMTGYRRGEIEGTNCRFLQGPETDPDTVAAVRAAVASRTQLATEILNYRKDGSAFWNALFISPVFDRRGSLVYFFGSQLDISRRRDAEDALRQAQKEALGQLTGGIAHDFNNLLQVIVGYVDGLRERAVRHGDDRMSRAVENIASAAQRATTLTQQLPAFARKQRLDGRPVNLNGLVDQMGELADRTLGGGIRVERHLASDLWNCRLDPVQAELAILNVLINARDAMPDGGRVTIETANRSVAVEDLAAFGNINRGRYAAIAITDTGQGIAPEILARVMDPFFTTKEEGKGTGLGLSMVYGFVKQSGGAVHIYSEVGRGTTVRLFFPVSDQDVRPAPKAMPRAIERQGTETVLVVEDRDDVAELAQTILEDFGYTVLMARAATEALAILDGAQRVDLLFSDLIMPGGMNGVMLAREARRRQPRLKVLLTTGYAEASLERTDLGGTEFAVINKPYGRMELIRRVRVVIDGPTGVG